MTYECSFFAPGDDTEYTVEYEAVYQPAKVNGIPEDCYPDESDMSILCVTNTETKQEVSVAFWEANLDAMEEKAWEHYMDVLRTAQEERDYDYSY